MHREWVCYRKPREMVSNQLAFKMHQRSNTVIGKRYLEIVPQKKQMTFSDNDLPSLVPETIDTETFNAWISTFDVVGKDECTAGATADGAWIKSTTETDSLIEFVDSSQPPKETSGTRAPKLIVAIPGDPKANRAVSTDATHPEVVFPNPGPFSRGQPAAKSCSDQNDEPKPLVSSTSSDAQEKSRFSGYDSLPDSELQTVQGIDDCSVRLPKLNLSGKIENPPPEPLLPSRSPLRTLHGANDRRCTTQKDDRTDKPVSGIPTGNSTIPSRRRREEGIRARKLRDLAGVRDSLSGVLRYPDRREATQAAEVSVTFSPINQPSYRPSFLDSRINSPSYPTGYTPGTGQTLSPVMLVAEQIEVPHGKEFRKPLPLLLKEPSPLRPTAKAVRTSTPPSSPTNIVPVPSETGEASLKVNPHASPLRSQIVRPRREMRHLAPGRSASGPSVIINRSSICSSHTSASKEARLEARLDALERENRLLEAALMAVLKTSGTLNKCPCALNKRDGRPDKRASEDSALTDGSGLSALDVYMGTRRRHSKGLSPG